MDVQPLNELMESDVQTVAAKETYLGYAKNVRDGHHAKLELTGNAFTVTFELGRVVIANLWDDDAEPMAMTLDSFIDFVSAWHR